MEPQGLSSARTLDWTLERTLEWAPDRTLKRAGERTLERALDWTPERANQAWRHRPLLPLGGGLQLLRPRPGAPPAGPCHWGLVEGRHPRCFHRSDPKGPVTKCKGQGPLRSPPCPAPWT